MNYHRWMTPDPCGKPACPIKIYEGAVTKRYSSLQLRNFIVFMIFRSNTPTVE